MEVLDRFKQLLEIMARLRGEGGCPWDHWAHSLDEHYLPSQEQSHSTNPNPFPS